jgi:hypothetical protein
MMTRHLATLRFLFFFFYLTPEPLVLHYTSSPGSLLREGPTISYEEQAPPTDI